MRKHGFQLPLNALQLLSISLYISFNVIFFVEIFPVFDSLQRVLIGLVYCMLSLLCGIFYALTTKIDPSDYNENGDSDIMFCSICKNSRSASSKHCGKCNRCVVGFDHHCRWVNNCIGSKNYSYFIGMIIVCEIFCIYYTGIAGFTLRTFAGNTHKFTGAIIVVGIATIFSIVGTGFLGHLIGFHVYLRCKHMTTYQHILQNRKKIGIDYHTAENNLNETDYNKNVIIDNKFTAM